MFLLHLLRFGIHGITYLTLAAKAKTSCLTCNLSSTWEEEKNRVDVFTNGISARAKK